MNKNSDKEKIFTKTRKHAALNENIPRWTGYFQGGGGSGFPII